MDEALKALVATGLFSDVRISHSGGRIVVTVAENPVINRVAFEGNKKAKDEQLKAEIQSKPRGTLSRPTVQADVQRIIEIYHRSGRFDVTVDPKIIELPNNRVDLVFEIKRRRQNRRQGNRVRRRKGVFARPVERRHQDDLKQLAELPADDRHLRLRTASKPTAICCAASI